MFRCKCGLVILSWKQDKNDAPCPQCNTVCDIAVKVAHNSKELNKLIEESEDNAIIMFEEY